MRIHESMAAMRAAHALFGALGAVVLWRTLAQGWVAADLPPEAVPTVQLAIPLLSAFASALAILTRRFRDDAISFAALIGLLAIVAAGPLSRDAAGIFFVAAIAIRFAPSVVALIREERGFWLVFLVAFGIYAGLASWSAIATAAYGDQVHYLLAADRLAKGSVDVTVDGAIFYPLVGSLPNDADRATHIVDTARGPRPVQGYALPALIAPGWALGGRLGAELIGALFAAWASAQTALLLRETLPFPRWRGLAWAMASFLPPLVTLAAFIYPNTVAAAVIVTAYRLLFTRAQRSVALGGVLLGSTLLLTPRDAIALVALAPFVWRERRFLVPVATVTLVAIVSNGILYGLPVPFAGYVFGTQAAQTLTNEPSLTFRFWVGLPAILFDRTFGVAGSAPWLFLALLGVVPAWRASVALRPALVLIAVSLAALSIYRYWEGGYAPPARYLVEVVPLLAVFAGWGLATMRDPLGRAFAFAVTALSATAGFVFAAMPDRALNDAFQQRLQDVFDAILGVNPLGWLPSFVPVTPDWWIPAYLRLVPALAIAALLVLAGARASGPARPGTPAPGPSTPAGA
jgi:hypothetical protein